MQVKLESKLLQTLRMEQIQSLEILQMSSLELGQYIQEKGNENPLLIVEEPKSYPDLSHLVSQTSHWTKNFNQKEDKREFMLERLSSSEESYERFLLEQLPLDVNLNELDQQIFLFLIRSLDDRLFLDVDLPLVAEHFKTTVEHVEALLELLQTLEPVGVGARNYIEYLLLQVDRFSNVPRFVEDIIQNDLVLVSKNKLKQLANQYNASMEEIKQAVEFIKKLKPIQSNYKDNSISYIVPDIEVQQIEGEWVIQLINQHLPTVQLHCEYINILKNSEFESNFKQYMKEASALLYGIEQRQKTIYNIVRLLLDIQPEFFEHGLKSLNPMYLKDIAAILGVHVSTISRAVRGKYLLTPHGIYSLQSLFTKGIVSSSGKMDSVMYIKRRIKELVDAEDKSKPLSDTQIATKLKEEGINVSRRTVTKYREELNIDSSFNRKLNH